MYSTDGELYNRPGVDRIKPILGVLAFLLIVWLLYPARELTPTPQNAEHVVEIMFMGPLGPISGTMADAVTEFERQSEASHRADPTRPIYRVVSGQSAAKDQVADPTRFLVSVAGGMPPDVIYFDRYAIAEWAARGAFDPLDPYIDRDLAAGRPETPRREVFFPAVWDEGVYKGRPYGIPNSVDDRALLYNEDLFIRAGLVDGAGRAQPPRTWEELIEQCTKLTEYDAQGRVTRAAFIPDYVESWLYQHAWSNGGELISDDGARVTLNSPRVVEALEFMKKLADVQGGQRQLAAFRASFQGDALDPFINGRVAMKLDGVWSLQKISDFGRDTRFAATPFPRPRRLVESGAPPLTFTGGFAYAIPSRARNKDAAWEFIRFMSSRLAVTIQLEADRATAESQGRPFLPLQQPNRELNDWAFDRYVLQNPTLPERFAKAIRVFNDLLPHSRFRPVTPVGQLMWSEQKNAMQSALYGVQSPKAALDEANANAQRALDRFLAPPSGTVIRSWTWFYVLYAVLLLVGASAAVGWHLRKHPSGTLVRRQWAGGVICASPWLLGFVVFGGGPMLFSLVMSFCDYDVLNPPRFVGVDNFVRMATEDRLMPIALWNTVFMVMAVPLQLAVGLGIALLLNQSSRALPFWRTMFYLPAIVPMVAAAVLWIWLLNPQGLINGALGLLGIEGPLWLQSAEWSKPGLILMKLWSAGGGMVIWLAGLKSIPQSLYEAAEVDGASRLQQFWSITIPQLTPYIFFNLIMGLIGTFQIFGEAFVMTQGGPVNSTLFYVYHLFNHAFRYGNMGYASAMAWVLFAVVLVLTAVQLRTSRRWVHYETD